MVVTLGSVLINVLSIGLKVRGLKPGRGRWILKGDKIRCTIFFRREIKPSVLYREILGHVKNPYRYENRYFIGKIQGHFSPSFSCFATRCLLVIAGELWWMKQE
jgi:hypothetical protein